MTQPPAWASTALVSLADGCRVGCAFCFRADKGSDQMDLPLLARVLSRLHELGIRAVCLTGGEPTDHPRFVESVRVVRQFDMECSVVTSARPGPSLDSLHRVHPLLGHVTVSADSDGAAALGGAARTIESAIDSLQALPVPSRSLHVVLWRLADAEARAWRARAGQDGWTFEFSSLYLDEAWRRRLGLTARTYVDQLRADHGVLTAHFAATPGLAAVLHELATRLQSPSAACCRSARLYVTADGHIRRCPYARAGAVDVRERRAALREGLTRLFAASAAVHPACAPICRGELG